MNAHLGARPWLAHARHDYAVVLMSRSQPGDQEHAIALLNEATARRWARAQGMPRYVFVKAPVEIQPFYVDFDSPIYVEIFAKTFRRSGEADLAEPLITVTEMFPEHRALWLQDAEGQSYTSEFRSVALDLAT